MAYVYSHTRLDTNEVFYIGISSSNSYKRAYNKIERNKYWKDIYNVTDIKIDLIYIDISIERAFEIERELISKYGRICNNSGILANVSTGGHGSEGFERSKDYRKKISEIKKKMSNETKSKISNSRKNMSEKARKSYSIAAKNMPIQQRLKITESYKNNLTKERRLLISKKSKENLTIDRIKKMAIGRSKILLDPLNGIFYYGYLEASIIYGLNEYTLWCYLNGKRTNKTHLKLV